MRPLTEEELLAQAINLVRDHAYKVAEGLGSERGAIADCAFLLTCAAYSLAQACGVTAHSEMITAEEAAWDSVCRARKGTMSEGGDA
jgi:hypothetical protein